MCGITGFLQAEPGDLQALIDAQLRTIRHRGPDAAGAFPAGCAVVGQNRLAIIDLEGGDPPILNEDGSIGVALNGEIYNFQQLQEGLLARGHQLRSRCDTEVLVHLAEEHDAVELARALDGMFGFAIWDSRTELLTLGRDRLGKKPLYYFAGAGTLVFGSEIKAVLAHPAVPRRLNERAIPAYLQFGYVPTPETFFAGIRSVPPGCVLTVRPGGEPRIERYWSAAVHPRRRAGRQSLQAAARDVRLGLTAAVERRMISDAPLGAFLSGGIDSSAIVALMSGLSDSPPQTFTIGFEDTEGYDERPYARLVAERYGTDHHEFVVAPNAIDLADRLVWHHDQPFGDSSAIPTFLLSELTGRHVKVALSGDGGDELFAGYERFAAAMAVGAYLRAPQPLRAAGTEAIKRLPSHWWGGRLASIGRFAANAERGMPDAYLAWISFIAEDDRRRLLRRADDWAQVEFQRAWIQTAGRPMLDRLLELNLSTYLLDDLLVKADRMSMAHGLEVRSPFLDEDLLSTALALPPALKVRGPILKRVLKAAVADSLPKEILSRRKRGFGVPLDRWFRTDLRSYLDATLLAPDARVRGHLMPDALEAMAAEHQRGSRNHGHALWTLLTLELFLRRQDW